MDFLNDAEEAGLQFVLLPGSDKGEDRIRILGPKAKRNDASLLNYVKANRQAILQILRSTHGRGDTSNQRQIQVLTVAAEAGRFPKVHPVIHLPHGGVIKPGGYGADAATWFLDNLRRCRQVREKCGEGWKETPSGKMLLAQIHAVAEVIYPLLQGSEYN